MNRRSSGAASGGIGDRESASTNGDGRGSAEQGSEPTHEHVEGFVRVGSKVFGEGVAADSDKALEMVMRTF